MNAGENEPEAIDSGWIARHPLPVHGAGTTKNSRGRVLVIGGGRRVPGALRLTGEAALRVGAGKVQLATIAAAAVLLGVVVPEAGVIALAENPEGEIAAGALASTVAPLLDTCDVLVLGPGIGQQETAARLLGELLDHPCDGTVLLLDAGAIAAAAAHRKALRRFAGRLVLTPHHGEMARLLDCDEDAVAADPLAAAKLAADTYGAVVALKATETLVVTPSGAARYGGGGIGLATAGSGDVLAGAIAGLIARGAAVGDAVGWAVWLHGQAGRRAAVTRGAMGFLARELGEELPPLLPQ